VDRADEEGQRPEWIGPGKVEEQETPEWIGPGESEDDADAPDADQEEE
jgi:hypothetical protein